MQWIVLCPSLCRAFVGGECAQRQPCPDSIDPLLVGFCISLGANSSGQVWVFARPGHFWRGYAFSPPPSSWSSRTGYTPTPIIILTIGRTRNRSWTGPSNGVSVFGSECRSGWQQRGVVTASSQVFFDLSEARWEVGALGAALHWKMMARLSGQSMGIVQPE